MPSNSRNHEIDRNQSDSRLRNAGYQALNLPTPVRNNTNGSPTSEKD
tara:strand:+ start:195 stop:335 length:141 start_codon:yes stop_codon:yes gene_type:complete